VAGCNQAAGPVGSLLHHLTGVTNPQEAFTVEPWLMARIVRRRLAETTDQETALSAPRPSRPVR